MDALSAFGLIAVLSMLVCYTLEHRSHWWTLGFAFTCLLSSLYGFLQGAWRSESSRSSGFWSPAGVGIGRKLRRT
jgi:hypothetical protein